MGNNYDSVAGYYDFMSRLVFGRSEIRAQVEMLGRLKTGDRLLIVGGGTGWILEEIAALFPSGLRIVYVESSLRMMERSCRRNCGRNEVVFIQAPVESYLSGSNSTEKGQTDEICNAGERGDRMGSDRMGGDDVSARRTVRGGQGEGIEMFDSILTPFFFDNFSTDQSEELVRLMDGCLKTGGYWLYADFFNPGGGGKIWRSVLLRSMYIATRILCGVEANDLPDMPAIFKQEGYGVEEGRYYYGRFIQSVVYRKELRGAVEKAAKKSSGLE